MNPSRFDAPPVGVARRKSSAILSRSRHLAPARLGFERLMAGGVLFLSVVGSVAAVHGGFLPMVTAPKIGLIAIAIAVQAVITGVEWLYSHQRVGWPYLITFGVDVALTVLGYRDVAIPRFADIAAWGGLPEPILVGGIALVIASGFIAWYPESALIND